MEVCYCVSKLQTQVLLKQFTLCAVNFIFFEYAALFILFCNQRSGLVIYITTVYDYNFLKAI